jgi:hypothetical protein
MLLAFGQILGLCLRRVTGLIELIRCCAAHEVWKELGHFVLRRLTKKLGAFTR